MRGPFKSDAPGADPHPFALMSHNAKAQDSYAQRAKKRSGDGPDQIICRKCNKPGHKAAQCGVRGPRGPAAASSVEASAREAVAQADGLKVALADKERELADLRSDKDAVAKAEEARAKEAAERLKAEEAQAALAQRICLGSSPMTLILRCCSLIVTLLAVSVQTFFLVALEHLLAPACLLIGLIRVLVTGRLFGLPMTLRSRCLGLLLLLPSLQVLNWVMFNFPNVLGCVLLVLACARTLWHVCVQTRSLLGLWISLGRLRRCPKTIWARHPGFYGAITNQDRRDDTVNSLPLRHAIDIQAKYTVMHMGFFGRTFVDVIGCGLACWAHMTGTTIGTVEDLICDHAFITSIASYFVTPIRLMVSASLARQVIAPRNTPTRMPFADVCALVERAAVHEGYSNVDSFSAHTTEGALRLNTSLYVQAYHARYREELAEAGF